MGVYSWTPIREEVVEEPRIHMRGGGMTLVIELHVPTEFLVGNSLDVITRIKEPKGVFSVATCETCVFHVI